MKQCLLFIVLIFVSRMAIPGIQPADMTMNTIWIINKKINDVNDPLQDITSRLTFTIDTSSPIPGASSTWVNGAPSITFTSSLLDVIFYTSELGTLTMKDKRWMPCMKTYSSYLRSSYRVMMLNSQNKMPITPLIPLEKYGSVCSGIEKSYPFNGKDKVNRDRQAQDSIGFIYLHELSHLYYRHVNYHADGLSDDEERQVNCAMRKQEKEADILATQKLVKFGWYRSALDISVWEVMLNLGIMETSRNSTFDHPSVIERMTYVLEEARSDIRASGKEISKEESDLIDQSRELQEKADKVMGEFDDETSGTGQCEI